VTRSDRSPHAAPTPAGTARIAVDLLGGDGAPAVVVDGALRACSADPDLHLLLVGPRGPADEVLGALSASDRGRVSVSVVEDVIGMAESPLWAVRRRDTTVRAVANLVYAGRADAMMSAGSTGAAVAAASHVLGRLPGVRRPTLAATVPGARGTVVLLDVGAALDATMLELVQHAVLGAAYASISLGMARPRVGLLSVGSEPGKGDRLRRAVAIALNEMPLPGGARYVGLVEGHDVPLGGAAQVVVTDGFSGNVLLKGIEGAYALAAARITDAARDGNVPPSVSVTKAATLLGVAGTVVVCHGAAGGADVASGIALASRLHHDGMTAHLAAIAGDWLTELSATGGLAARDALGERS
jgi:phosphate acyltransferase